VLSALWHCFGIYDRIVPEGSPPGIDWQTGRPSTYGVDHSDGFIPVDSQLREHFVAAGVVRGRPAPASIRHLLDSQGRL
jgi:hypothetical protein